MAKGKTKPLDINVQAAKLRKIFPESKTIIVRNKLIWKGSLTPNPISETYDIKIEYKIGYHPCIYVINKKLDLFPNINKLPHVYDTNKQWLCLYFRKAHEWKNHNYISDTIIPWTSEWLYHYEFWLATGIWYGRGIHSKFEPYHKDKNPSPGKMDE
jgi:hypothetical protein